MVKKVTLPDGREVSRQYAHYIKSDRAKQLHKEAVKRYKGKPEIKDKMSTTFKRFTDKFFLENGVTYSTWYYHNVLKQKRQNAKKEA